MDPEETQAINTGEPSTPSEVPLAADLQAPISSVELTTQANVPLPDQPNQPPGLEIARELAGGPRNDVIIAGPQNDTIEGQGGDDNLDGGEGHDILIGGPGNDTQSGGPGNDGARYSGSVFEYEFTRGNGEVTVRHTQPEGGRNDGTDRLTGIERLEFLDRKVFIDGTNNAPIARPDTGFTVEDGNTLRIPVASLLANDREFDGDPLRVSDLPRPQARGSARIEGNTIVYTPPSGFQWALAEGDSYDDVFAYTASDGKGGTAVATAKVTVTRPSDPRNYPTGPATRNNFPAGPGDVSAAQEDISVAQAQTYSLWDPTVAPTPAPTTDSEGRAVELGVKFQANTNGRITGLRFYKAPENTGTHVGNLWTATGTNLANATFSNETDSGWQQVSFANPVPITAGTTYVASYQAPTGTYSVTENYFTQAYTNGPLTAPASTGGNGNGVYRYGAVFPTQTFRASNYWVDVVFEPDTTSPTNTPPVANNDSGFTTPAGTALTIPAATLLSNDTDANGDTLTIASVGSAVNGTVALQNNASEVVFTPTASGPASFTYTVSDGRGGTSNAATVSLTVATAANSPPAAAADSASTNEDTAVTINVLANDSDPDGNPLTITALDRTGTQGVASINANNTVTYNPAGAFQSLNAGQTATDSFAYIVSDGQGGSATATVTMTITGLDDAVKPVVAENQKVGNPQSEWGINGPDPAIEGFATNISVNQGERVDFKVRTAARDYRLDIYRLGYYGGAGARKVATVQPSAALPQNQPAPLIDSAARLVDAGNWNVSASWDVPADAVSGVYIAKLVREDGTFGENHISFIVRDDDGGSDLLFQTADTTWHAYNIWGGRNFYTGSSGYNTNDRAYKLSYNRPFGDAVPTTPNKPIFDAEYPMIRWLEANGYDVSYSTDVDTDRRGQELLEHDVFLSVGHDEYWSGQQRTNVEAARDAGVNLAFFAANDVYWKTRWENSIDGSGTPHRTLVSYKETWGQNGTAAKIDPDPAWTGTWRDPRFSPPSDGGRPENKLIGTLFQVDGYRLDTMKVPAADGKMRFWRNTSVANQSSGQVATLNANVLGYEWNEDLDNGFRPEGAIRLSDTTIDVPAYLLDYGNTTGPGTATHNMTLNRDPESRALTFSAGTTRWSWGLDGNHINESSTPDPRMQQATVNLFADMEVQPGTLRPGLVSATPSTDTTAPTSSIASPSSGSSTTLGSTVTISGTASDSGGRVGGVEVSVDGGSTWHRASGRENWSYNWTPQTAGTVTLRSRAIDDSLNMQSPGSSVSVTVQPQSGPQSIWSASATPATVTVNDPNAVELGVKFRANTNGSITGLRFYKGSQNTGTHVGNLWTATGTKLATATFNNETASGWQQVNFTTPVAITANTTYVASYHAPNGMYSASSDYFATSGVNSGNLQALASPDAGGNGVYAYGASAFPTNSFRSTNYWVDVLFAA